RLLDARARNHALRIVAAVRSGFEDAVYDAGIGDQDKLAQLWTRARWHACIVPLYPLTRDDLRAAIPAPADARTVFFPARPRDGRTLLDTILDDVERTPSPLPLLSISMWAMYRELAISGRGDREIGWAEYDQIAPIGRALATQLSVIYEGN